jgi:hypothetical protein
MKFPLRLRCPNSSNYKCVLRDKYPVPNFSYVLNWKRCVLTAVAVNPVTYRGADKSLARPGRKQATATEDFDFHISYLLS